MVGKSGRREGRRGVKSLAPSTHLLPDPNLSFPTHTCPYLLPLSSLDHSHLPHSRFHTTLLSPFLRCSLSLHSQKSRLEKGRSY